MSSEKQSAVSGEFAVENFDRNDDFIKSRIYTVRGMQVMLDRDLAALYGVEVKYLNRQVKRNIERFPADFMFQLSKEECLRCQIVTLNEGRGQHLKYMPYAFTENGIAMLSGVLRSHTAIEVNIKIMRVFNAMRRMLASMASFSTARSFTTSVRRLRTLAAGTAPSRRWMQCSSRRSWRGFDMVRIDILAQHGLIRKATTERREYGKPPKSRR